LFSWDAIGQRALGAIQEAITRWRAEHPAPSSPPARPRLAMVTPAPPAQSGIAYYAATLIRALSRFYQIDLVLKDGLSTDDPFILANCSVLDASTFRGRYSEYDRVVYHFGNSDHHSHMVDLIADCPGVVVLHDYFVSDLSSWREHLGGVEGNWGYDLYESHGIGALLERHSEPDLFKVINKYPCSYAVTRHAASVLCHSEEARALQIEWHGSEAARDWRVVPMIRTKPKLPPRSQARRELNVADDEFLVCAFGILGRSKLNHRLIEAWMSSRLGTNNKCRLVFVGGHGPEDYYNELTAKVRQSGAAAQVGFSGWVDEATYWRYLSAADVAVQLRGLTHGETSAATLDAMLAGLAVVANRSSVLSKEADHAIAYIAADAPAEELAETLDRLHRDTAVRSRLGSAAQAYATANHSESSCGETFRAAVEHASTTSMSALNAAVDGIATLDLSPQEAAHIADVLAAAVDQRAAMVVDVTSLISELPDQFAFTLGPLLSRLAQLQPRLRVVAVEDRAGEYWSVMDNIRRAALYPHIHRAPERVLLKSVDWLVSLHPADADVARQAAARSGADHLALTMDDRSDPESLAVRIADFVRSTRSTREASFARYFDTAPDEGAPLRTFPGEPLPDRGKLRLNEMAR
jgi:glycosyltransferase involved in cell wall biosynthesis